MDASTRSIFTPAELARVGTAVTMMVACGTVIIVGMTIALGHYNSLAHALPKAIVDGLVIALLLGNRGRFRCLALLGIVYGLVLLLQFGVFYLVPVMAVAGLAAAAGGRAAAVLHRPGAIVLAAILYELLAGFGAPIKIYFGTDGRSEPFLWGMWLAEWPLRIVGAGVGVMLARRRANRGDAAATVEPEQTVGEIDMPKVSRPLQQRGVWHAGVCTAASVAACVLPMIVQGWVGLAAIAVWYLLFALAAGLRRGLLAAAGGLFWGWLVFALASYAWHHDSHRIADLLRTFVLRFAPITFASMVLVATVRPVDLVRLLRRLRLGAIIILPLAHVARSLPEIRREMHRTITMLRNRGEWSGPISILRRPRHILRSLLAPPMRRWASALAERD
jgi:hypothetical protein